MVELARAFFAAVFDDALVLIVEGGVVSDEAAVTAEGSKPALVLVVGDKDASVRAAVAAEGDRGGDVCLRTTTVSGGASKVGFFRLPPLLSVLWAGAMIVDSASAQIHRDGIAIRLEGIKIYDRWTGTRQFDIDWIGLITSSFVVL